MSVVSLKRYSYLDWLQIADRANCLRMQGCRTVWPDDDIAALWHALFAEPA